MECVVEPHGAKMSLTFREVAVVTSLAFFPARR